MDAFERSVQAKLHELEYNATTDPTPDMYDKICSAIQHAVDEVLPTVRRKGNGVRRKVSETTRALYAQRTKLCGQGSKEQFDKIQSEIRKSSLQDFERWVQEWADNISKAESKGDIRGIFKGVNALARKQSRPPANLNTDSDGNMLQGAEDVVETWYKFLRSKFAATTAENDRPEMEDLPCTQGKHALPVSHFELGLKKMNDGKATGPDQIPVKLYKSSELRTMPETSARTHPKNMAGRGGTSQICPCYICYALQE